MSCLSGDLTVPPTVLASGVPCGFTYESEVLVTVAGHANAMTAGEVVLLPAGKPHAVRATTRFKMLLTMIRSRAKP